MSDRRKAAGRDYLKVVYKDGERPASDYPDHLARELVLRTGLRPDMRLLDVGCGRGEMLAAFARSGLACTGLDLAEGAGSLHPDTEIRRVDILRDIWPVEDNSCDAVFMKSVIEHLPDPVHVLSESLRVLKAGGALIVLTPDFASNVAVFYEDPTHVHPYVPKSLGVLLSMHGFSHVTSEIFCHHERLWSRGTAWLFGELLWLTLTTPLARKLALVTGLKIIRWAVERQVLGIARKPETHSRIEHA